FDGARFTSGRKIPGGLRVTVTRAAFPPEKLAGSAPHDTDDDRRHAALRRARLGDWNLFRFHAALSFKNPAIDWHGMGLPLQQDCSCNRGNPARCRDLGDARDLSRRVSFGLLESAAAASPACTFPSVRASRLRALACIFTSRLAHVLACLHWFALPRRSFSDHNLFCDAVAGESGSNATEGGLIRRGTFERVASAVCESECLD